MKAKKLWLFCLILSSFLCFFTACSNTNQSKVTSTKANNSDKIDFLKNNYSSIDISDNNDFSTFKLLDSSLEDYEIFFTAENHAIAVNSQLELKFIKYFKQKAGIKYLLLEIPYSDGQILNQYLATGDESIIAEMYKPLKGTFAWNKQSYDNWKKIYELNKSLPEDEKITVIGIDIEHQYVNAIRYLNSLIPNKTPPKVTEEYIEKIKQIFKKTNSLSHAETSGEFSKKLDQSIKSNRKMYEEYFGEKLFDFELVNENIIAQVKAYKDDNAFNQIRDERMYENFKKIYPHIQKGKFYGQWGLNHAFQREQMNTSWLASRMNGSDSPVKGKVLSIVYLYKNCKYRTAHEYKLQNITTSKSLEDVFSPLADNDITIFKLTGNNSPFEKQIYWPYSQSFTGTIPTEGKTTDYFQFLILIKNSDSTTPLGI